MPEPTQDAANAVIHLDSLGLEAGIDRLCEQVAALIDGPAGGEVVCDLSAVRSADLSLVGVLARLTLTARRAGGSLLLRNAGEELRRLIDFSGLACVLEVECSPSTDD
jgi:anti-anti-sigma factor